jgi:glycosyltransferase involved in cell wall biosynthesis
MPLLPGPAKQTFLATATAAFKAGKLPAAVSATMQRPEYLRRAANLLEAIMVPTELMRTIFEENGIEPQLIHKVPFGLDTAPLLPHQEKVPSSVIRIGFVGTIFEHKGLDLLLSAFQQLPPESEAVLKIYGDPKQFPEYGSAMLKLAESGVNRKKIQFLGTFPNSRLGEVLQELDVLAVPSRWYENTPLVIQSAFATRTPVLATDLGGMSELVKHNQNGLLFEVNNIESLKTQLLRLIEDKDLLLSLRRNIEPERTVSQMVDDIEMVYETVLNRTGKKNAEPEGVARQTMVS